MSVFPTAKHLCSWAGVTPQNNESAGKKHSVRISRAGVYIKPLLVQCSNAVVKSQFISIISHALSSAISIPFRIITFSFIPFCKYIFNILKEWNVGLLFLEKIADITVDDLQKPYTKSSSYLSITSR